MSKKVEIVEDEAEEEEWGDAAAKAAGASSKGGKGEVEGGDDDDDDDDSAEWTNESDNEDPDGELGRIEWIERTKRDIAQAVPNAEDSFWNCPICGNTCIATSFVRMPEKKELGAPAACVHVFDCLQKFREQYGISWDWETKPGQPKEGFDVDGAKIEPDVEPVPL